MDLPKAPWKLAFNSDVADIASLRGKTLEPHEGYLRHNNGDWIITDATGRGIGCANFQSEAKRGTAHLAPDPVGQMVGRIMAAGAEAVALLESTQPLLEVAMHEAQKKRDRAFLERLQIQYAANRDALNRVRG